MSRRRVTLRGIPVVLRWDTKREISQGFALNNVHSDAGNRKPERTVSDLRSATTCVCAEFSIKGVIFQRLLSLREKNVILLKKYIL